VVRGGIEGQVLTDQLKSDLLRRKEVGLNQDAKTGVYLVGKNDLLKRQEGGLGQDGETGVVLVSESDLLRRQEGSVNLAAHPPTFAVWMGFLDTMKKLMELIRLFLPLGRVSEPIRFWTMRGGGHSGKDFHWILC
jgi:hypothetical protein